MSAAAQFLGKIADRDNSHLIAVLLLKNGSGAFLARRIIILDTNVECRIPDDLLVHDLFDPAEFIGGNPLVVSQIETQVVRRHQ